MSGYAWTTFLRAPAGGVLGILWMLSCALILAFPTDIGDVDSPCTTFAAIDIAGSNFAYYFLVSPGAAFEWSHPSNFFFAYPRVAMSESGLYPGADSQQTIIENIACNYDFVNHKLPSLLGYWHRLTLVAGCYLIILGTYLDLLPSLIGHLLAYSVFYANNIPASPTFVATAALALLYSLLDPLSHEAQH